MGDSFARGMQRRADQARRKQERQHRREQFGKDVPTRVLFHGTAGPLADSIEANGIRLGSDGRCYVTDDSATALAYATWSAGLAGATPPTTATDVGRKIAKLGRYVAAVAVIRLPADHPLEVEDAFPPPLPWEDEITAGDCYYLHEPIPSWAVSGWEFYRPAELCDEAKRKALWRDSDLIAEAFARSGGGKAGGPFRDAIPGPVDLIAAVREASPTVSSMHHGDDHWLQVAMMGQRLLRADERPDADAATVFAFSLLHDSQRHSEGSDPEHGARAAAFARELTDDGLLALGDDRLVVLCDALERHDQGETSDEPTTGACWDADRLTLARLGIKPDLALLSTAAGRSLAPDAGSLVFKPADWRFAIFRYSLEAAAPLIADELAEAA